MVGGADLGAWWQAFRKCPFVKSPLDALVVVSKRKGGDSRYRVDHKVGRVTNETFEKLIVGTQYKVALLQYMTGLGRTFNGVLSHASGWIDSTRIFTEINWALNGEKYSKDKDWLDIWCDRALHGCMFGLGVLSTACALDHFGIYDFASISAKIGGITSYGGLGVIGAIPVIHSMIAILMVVLVVGNLREKNWDVWAIWNDTEARWKTAGRLAEIVLRVATLTLGSAPILIPILGIISQDIGLYYSVKGTEEAIAIGEEFDGVKYRLERKDIHVNSLVSEFTAGISKVAARIIQVAARIVQVASEIFASIDGLDSFTKFLVPVCAIVAPQRKELIATMKNYRLVSAPRKILTALDGPSIVKNEEDEKKCPWRNTARKVTGYGGFVFLTTGYGADFAKFVTKSNIANLAGYANDLGKFKIFGFLGTVSFNTIKASSMFVVIILDLGRIAVDFNWDKIKNNQTLQIELLIKVSLAIGKIVAIFISGGFMFYAGWGAASAASNIIQAIVFGADFANSVVWKGSIKKPKTEYWGPSDNDELKLTMTSERLDKENKRKEEDSLSTNVNELGVDVETE